jgi:tRNA uridine 5-carboxymethylaminomethyl modification enzyme
VMTRPGYAIEYDFVPPTQLHPTLATRANAGLFLAGQINGSTGYEEAGGQGIVAGLNAAAFALGLEPITFGREDSYIGVLVDDLVTRGVDEPYRLFTSRSEFRLTVRQDNALRRLSGIGTRLGLYTSPEQARVERRLAEEDEATVLAQRTSVAPAAVAPVLARAGERLPAHAVPVVELARRQKVPLKDLFAAAAVGSSLSADAVLTADLGIKYDGYLARERAAADRLRRLGEFVLPGDAPYDAMRTLSVEARQKLGSRRPATLAQAAGIPGVTPADLQNLVLEVERWQRG